MGKTSLKANNQKDKRHREVFIIYLKANALKNISSSYVQNMIENMILTLYSDKLYFIAG